MTDDPSVTWDCCLCPFTTPDVRDLIAHMAGHGYPAHKVRTAPRGYPWRVDYAAGRETAVTYLLDGKPAFGVMIREEVQT